MYFLNKYRPAAIWQTVNTKFIVQSNVQNANFRKISNVSVYHFAKLSKVGVSMESLICNFFSFLALMSNF